MEALETVVLAPEATVPATEPIMSFILDGSNMNMDDMFGDIFGNIFHGSGQSGFGGRAGSGFQSGYRQSSYKGEDLPRRYYSRFRRGGLWVR